jgi:Uncharacterised nucleotidyltransferase
MPQSPEIELLLLCARPQVTDGVVTRMHALLQQQPDWELIFRLAGSHRTIPLLAYNLHQHATRLLASDIQARLQKYHRDTTWHNMVLAVEVLRLIDLFSTRGINVVPFKGTVSAILAYGDMAMRACGDIDLLVKQQDHGKAEQLLENEGYRVVTRYQDALQSGLYQEQRRIYVDLHWGIPPDYLQLDTDRLWDDLGPIDLLGRSVLTFSPRDTVLVTATNVVKEYAMPSLHHLSDIAALTGRYTDEDWAALFRRACEIGCQRMLIAALLFSRRLLHITLPSSGPARLFRHHGINRVVDELQDHLFLQSDEQDIEEETRLIHQRDARVYNLALTDSPWRRCRSWLNWAGTPNSADHAFIRLPMTLAFLYFLVRPLRLLIKYTGRHRS